MFARRTLVVAAGLALVAGGLGFAVLSTPKHPAGVESAPLRDLAAAAAPVVVGEIEGESQAENIPHLGISFPDPLLKFRSFLNGAGTGGAAATGVSMPAATSSFEGMGTGLAGFSVGYIPPDVSADVGPTQIVEVVNASLAVFSKGGSLLLGPVATRTLWTGFAGLCGTDNNGDGIVRYDRAADRWVVAQFALDGANGTTVPFLECVAVSQTGDATGAWYRYAFPYSNFPDYPKLGIWGDSYAVTFNLFTPNVTAFVGGLVCGYDRARMIAGLAATQQCFSTGVNGGGALAADTDSAAPAPSGAPAPIVAIWDTTSLATWQLTLDWATPANSGLSGPTLVTVAPFSWPSGCGPSPNGCVAQRGTTEKLDALGDRLMNRLAYRNDAGVERMVVAHTVGNGTSIVATRWYDLAIAADRSVSVADQGTYAPTTDSRWMASAARDSAGDLAIGYSLASAAKYDSIAWAGRVPSDPAGTLGQGETIGVAGGGSQNGTYSRWGDYTALVVDPTDDCTFWYTGEYYAASSAYGWRTRISSFSFPGCTGTPTPTPSAPLSVTGVADNGQVTVSWLAPASSGTSAITGYSVTASPGGSTCTTAGALSCAVTGLTNGTPYTFTVSATNGSGPGSASSPSAPVTPRTVPGAPTSVTGTPGSGQVTVSWLAPASNGGSAITGYSVTASSGGNTCITTGALSCAVTGLTNGTAYTFTVFATNIAGPGPLSSPSPSVTPSAATGTTVTALTYTGVKTAAPGAAITMSATLKSGTVALAGKTVTFKLNGVTSSATTNASGVASVATTAPATPGSYPIVVAFAGDATYAPSTKSQTLADQFVTKVAYTGPTTAVHGASITLSATLKTTAGLAIAGRTVTFKLNNKTFSATTNALGIASVSTTAPTTAKSYTIAVTFSGDSSYAKSSVNATLKVS